MLADAERLLGPEHPTTLQERVVADCTRILGADHPNTITAEENLAAWRSLA